MPKRKRTARKIKLVNDKTVTCIWDDGTHYMVADHWPEDRDFDVCAVPIENGYEVVVAGQCIGTASLLSQAAELADRDVSDLLGATF
jgi:hypothetical protein